MSTYKSVAAVIQELRYWLRLATFVHDPLKHALLDVLHNRVNDATTYIGLSSDPDHLNQELKSKQGHINFLMSRGIINQAQVNLLLPPHSNKTYSDKFDVTLINVVIRNFTTLPPPINGWNDKNPPANDTSIAANVIRAKEWRNWVIHEGDPEEIDQAMFDLKWEEGTQIIRGLGYLLDTEMLKTVSLDPDQKLQLQSLFTLIEKLESFHAADISSLRERCKIIEEQIRPLHMEREEKVHQDVKSSSCCLPNVLEYIFQEMKEKEAEDLLSRLNAHTEGNMVDNLQNVPWQEIKKELELLERTDLIENIRKTTLITQGLKNASDKLRNHYMKELIKYLVEQPLSSKEMDSFYTYREDTYIDLTVLPSAIVDEEWSNSDRDSLIRQSFRDRPSREKAVDKVVDAEDELIFIRGVAGMGKSTLIDMFTLKWAKKELKSVCDFDFVFKFTCREINAILNEFENLEEFLKLQYPNIFCDLTLEELAEVSEKVLIIVDGMDELKDIYQLHGDTPKHLKIIIDLINTKCKKLIDHKTIVCGRPKACEFIKKEIYKTCKVKTVDVCGFNEENISKFILKFFDRDNEKANTVQRTVESSYELKHMSRVPIFLWVICNVYSEDLIKTTNINSHTELYFYTCLIFLRNHYQGPLKKHQNLFDLVEDESVIEVIYSLMQLSVKTYMNSQVLFTDEDIKELTLRVHLEQTGFIVKYCRSNTKIATYQFRHLVLQEFFCALYIRVSKEIDQFSSNNELSGCWPTVMGIHRIVEEKENDIFLKLFNALKLQYKQKPHSFFSKLVRRQSFRSATSRNVPRELPVPSAMIEEETLLITETADCLEFLALFKETKAVSAPHLTSAVIQFYTYEDTKNILDLLEKLGIKIVRQFSTTINDLKTEEILKLCKITAGPEMTLNVILRDAPQNCQKSTILLGEPNHISLHYWMGKEDLNIKSLLPKGLIESANSFFIDYHH